MTDRTLEIEIRSTPMQLLAEALARAQCAERLAAAERERRALRLARARRADRRARRAAAAAAHAQRLAADAALALS